MPRKRAGSRKYGAKASEKVERAMHEYKRGQLKSGRSGRTVKSRKQAIAIGLSEARERGAKVPTKAGGRTRKSGGRKSSTRSRTAKASRSTSGGSRSTSSRSRSTSSRSRSTSSRSRSRRKSSSSKGR